MCIGLTRKCRKPSQEGLSVALKCPPAAVSTIGEELKLKLQPPASEERALSPLSDEKRIVADHDR